MALKSKHVSNASGLIDDYINSLPEFSKKICSKLRKIILAADPEIIEDWKWGPNYYKNGMLCGFGGFKHHVHLSFFNGAFMKDPKRIFTEGGMNMHNRGVKFKDAGEIEEKLISNYIKESVKVNEKGIPAQNKSKDKSKVKTIIIPADLKKALVKSGLLKKFEGTNYTNKKEYAEWVNSAKKKETRDSRVRKTVDRIDKGIKFS